jgi:hypothetical protein
MGGRHDDEKVGEEGRHGKVKRSGKQVERNGPTTANPTQPRQYEPNVQPQRLEPDANMLNHGSPSKKHTHTSESTG